MGQEQLVPFFRLREGRLNILLGTLLFIICALVGFRVASKYHKKLVFIQDFKTFLDFFETNIMFTQNEISTLLNEKKTAFHNEFNLFLDGYQKNLTNIKTYLDEWTSKQNLVDKDTAELISNFMQGLGRIDSTAQLEAIRQTKESLNTHLDKTREEQKKGAMSSRLGVMAGLALFIVVL